MLSSLGLPGVPWGLEQALPIAGAGTRLLKEWRQEAGNAQAMSAAAPCVAALSGVAGLSCHSSLQHLPVRS